MQPKTATVDHALGDPVCVDCEKVVDNGFVCEGCGNPLHEDCGDYVEVDEIVCLLCPGCNPELEE